MICFRGISILRLVEEEGVHVAHFEISAPLPAPFAFDFRSQQIRLRMSRDIGSGELIKLKPIDNSPL